MLNQVPRTLLNMGADGNEKHASSGSSLDWNDTTGGNTDMGVGGGEGAPPRVVTPHSKVFNSSREGEVAPHSAASPALRPASMAGFRGGSMERRGSREGAGMGLGGRGSMSSFTNESIADEALSEFGSGEVSPYLFLCTAKSFSMKGLNGWGSALPRSGPLFPIRPSSPCTMPSFSVFLILECCWRSGATPDQSQAGLSSLPLRLYEFRDLRRTKYTCIASTSSVITYACPVLVFCLCYGL